jgi:hypothetical protein
MQGGVRMQEEETGIAASKVGEIGTIEGATHGFTGSLTKGNDA